jgi:hypothetical protein
VNGIIRPMAFLRDIGHAFRTPRRTPGLVCIAVLTLALGIGANTAIFSVIYSVLLKPLAFPDTDRIVQIWMAFPERSIDRTSWSHANFWDTRSMTTASLGALVPLVRTALSSIDPALPLSNVQTMEEVVSASTSSARFTVSLLTAFAGLAMILALVGIFGVTAYSVSRQTAEIGVRLALGASNERVLRDVVGQAMTPVAIGIAVGAGLSLLLSRVIANLLLGISPHDPVTYLSVSVLLGATALVACVLPARQALRIDVISALRAE